MSLSNSDHCRRLAGRTLLIGLPGPDLDGETGRRVEGLGPGGVILFGRNLHTPARTAGLLEAFDACVPHPTLRALDQEGGQVNRLDAFVGPTPPATAQAGAGVEATEAFARATGEALRALGFNLDFAPVVDLCSVEATNGIGNRSFGTDPESVTRQAAAFLDGLEAAGVAGCLKHFPGLGATCVDSHHALPTVERTLDELRRLDLEPYRRLVGRAPAVMVGHVLVPDLDADRPATLSAHVVNRLLRGEIGYEGLVVTDDLEMGAVAPRDVDGAAAVDAMSAGCDLLLYCADLDRAERAAEALTRQATDEPAFRRRLEAAAAAVDATARTTAARTGPAFGWDAAGERLRRASARITGLA